MFTEMIVKIEFGNIKAKISNVPDYIKNEIAETLSYKLIGFSVDKDRKYLYDPANGITFTGLLKYVLNILIKNNIKYELIDKREKPEPNANFKMNPMFTARDYQQEIIDYASCRHVIQACTGAGKTFMMASFIVKFNVKPVVVIAPKVSLAFQIKEEFERFLGIKVGIVGDGICDIQDITVGTPQSIAKESILEEAKMLMVDECHFLPSTTIFNCAKKAREGYYRFAVSATPWRDSGDDLLIEAVFDKRNPKKSINASKLIRKEKLVPCTINFIKIDSRTEWLGSYAKTYRRAISENYFRNKKIVDLAVESLKTRQAVLILISKVAHGKKILEMIKNQIILKSKDYYINGTKYTINNAEFISGVDNVEYRQAVFAAVKDGFCQYLIGSTIADEGLDCPPLDTLILAGAGKSSTRAFQRVGRVLRLNKGKKNAIVYDFMDSNSTFYKQALTRQALYETEDEWKINII